MRAAAATSRVEWWRAKPTPASTAPTAADRARLPFVGIMAFTFVLFVAPQGLFPRLAPLRLALVTAVFAVAAYASIRLVYGRPLTSWSRQMALALALPAWALMTVPFSMWPGGSVTFMSEIYLKSVVVFWLLANVVNTPRRLHTIVWSVTLMAVPAALTAVRSYHAGIFTPRELSRFERIVGYESGMMANPNDLALTLNMILPLTVALALTTRRRWVRLLLVGIAVLDVTAIVLSFSRGGFVTLAVSGATMLWKVTQRSGPGWAMLTLAAVLVAAPMLPSSYFNRLATITDTDADETGSSQERWANMKAAVQYTLGHPVIGAGVGQNQLALSATRGIVQWSRVHNVYLQISTELGGPGLLMYLALVAGCIRAVTRVERDPAVTPKTQPLSTLAMGVRMSLVGYAVAAFFHPTAYHFYFYYFGGLALAVRAIHQHQRRA